MIKNQYAIKLDVYLMLYYSTFALKFIHLVEPPTVILLGVLRSGHVTYYDPTLITGLSL